MATPGDQEEGSLTGQTVCHVDEEPQEQPIEQPVVQPQPRREPRQPNRGGYDCDFVKRPLKVQTECSICLLVLRSPHLVTCCGQNFCKECIERVQKDEKCCPLCNTVGFTVVYNREKDISLKDFEVYCTYRKLGCEWKGKLKMLDNHLNVNSEPEKQLEGCTFAEVQCCHDGCGQSLQRRLIAQHQGEECDQRPFSCDYCHDYNSSWYNVVANHFPECKCYPVPCPHYCTPYTIERQHLEPHLNKDCPLQEVECEFEYAGCQIKLPRKDMPEHLKESVGHMTLLARHNRELTAKLMEKDDTIKGMVEGNRREMEEKAEGLKISQQQSSERLTQQNQELSAMLLEKEETIKRMVEENRREMEKIERLAVTQQQTSERLVWQMQEVMEEVRRIIDENRRLEERVQRLARKQEETKREMEDRVRGLAQKEDTAKAVPVKPMGDLEEKQEVTISSVENPHRQVQIAPVRIAMPNFGQHKRISDEWYSEGFYTHPQGYKMCLLVYADGTGGVRGLHVSCFIYLMRGEFDDHLKWPFRGVVTVQLLNQREDRNHCTRTVPFNASSSAGSTARVTSGERAVGGLGHHEFIPHSELGYDAVSNGQYLMNDCVYFRVKVELK